MRLDDRAGSHGADAPPARGVLALTLLLALALPIARSARAEVVQSADSAPAPDLERDVLPILAERCGKCHGERRQKGDLRLDSAAAIARGGERGPVIALDDAGGENSDRGTLLRAISWRDDDLRMPPKTKLPDEEIAVIERWVAGGARGVALEAVDGEEPAGAGAGADVAGDAGSPFDAQDRAFWFFQPLADPGVPVLEEPQEGDPRPREYPVDAFVRRKLLAVGLDLAPEADRRTLIRRLSFDLLGVPPTPEEIESFVTDDSPHAWEKVVDRMMSSPRHGERFARHWLDLVRYADSNGYRADEYREHAWRYRDWVVAALNEDEPYDRFVAAQLAGDEIAPDDPDALVATGFLRLWPYESNQKNVRGQWNDIVNDVTDVTGEVLLGLSMRCARCHDHKFDAILQEDYYRLRAFLGTFLPRRGLRLAVPEERTRHERELARWLEESAEIRREIEEIEARHYQGPIERSIVRFPESFQPILRAPRESLSPLDRQLRDLGYWQVFKEAGDIEKAVKGKDAERRKELLAELAKLDAMKPAPLPEVMAVVDVGYDAPVNYIPGRESLGDVRPGYLSILDPALARIEPVREESEARTSWRRATLARWITREDNRLSTRVIANRIWQYCFGRGIVATPNDFGTTGARPTHPELLDWLARELPARGWSLKSLERLLVTSRTYRQASVVEEPARAREVDAANDLLWRTRPRRLTAEELRDATLACSGRLELRVGGPGADHGKPRRSIYLKVLRNRRAAMMDVFDGPDGFNSCSRRNETTTAPQALLLLNGEQLVARARALAARAREAGDEVRSHVDLAYRIALGRPPSTDESRAALEFIASQSARIAATAATAAGGKTHGSSSSDEALVDFCHVLFNANEFLYVD